MRRAISRSMALGCFGPGNVVAWAFPASLCAERRAASAAPKSLGCSGAAA
eukprot:CAMPEP_0176123268 /NCGR_PEP_ID=MMETSP0120_2-20121206/62107_1 /TAXON_ID=160619 /ORGANISM="Kryptoperidinium foliaceum, Strain CCMP 1326" /LENGTH=49 /DNA_ID= /DNA_START= /DNA_END= /DNA_ORIENTATION=